MKMRFIGDYTNGRDSISYLGCTFEGREAREVSAEVETLLKGHPEFEAIHPLDHDGDGVKGGPAPRKKRGRKPKAQA